MDTKPFRGLTRAQAEAYYDRFGARQDHQRYYEAIALSDLVEHGRFNEASTVVEFGCGTGQFAEELLARQMASSATYWGCDLSATMVALAATRLHRFGARAAVWKSAGGPQLPLPEGCADHFVSNYVLDLLPASDIGAVLAEAKRLLRPAGRLCLVSLTHGSSGFPRWVTAWWQLRFALRPAWVGGCRPLDLRAWLAAADWEIQHHRIVSSWEISSEVIVALKRSQA